MVDIKSENIRNYSLIKTFKVTYFNQNSPSGPKVYLLSSNKLVQKERPFTFNF